MCLDFLFNLMCIMFSVGGGGGGGALEENTGTFMGLEELLHDRQHVI